MTAINTAFAPQLAALSRQNLLFEYATLRYANLDGLYVTITPGDPSLWAGVMFLRTGPYAPAILRFQISFPPEYPSLPPLVTFSTDIFHPLLTPLTTYTYTTSDTDTVSATDDERLPPGGFSLRHGFPHWFGRARKSAPSSRNVSGSATSTGTAATSRLQSPVPLDAAASDRYDTVTPETIPVVEILRYMLSAFTDPVILNSVPIELAANQNAFHAWRTYRADVDTTASSATSPSTHDAGATSVSSDARRSGDGVPSSLRSLGNPNVTRARQPGEWNWEGVWEERVRKAIRASISEAVLYGGTGGDDLIRFLDLDEEYTARVREQLELTLATAESLAV